MERHLDESLNFFPLADLQLGCWLSALHIDRQIFLFVPDEDRLVFVAVLPKPGTEPESKFISQLSRKEIHQHFGRNSPFAAPRSYKPKKKLGFGMKMFGTISSLRAETWGVTALEIPLSEFTGFDYCNTLVYCGCRIVVEAKVITKKWFQDLTEFCMHYNIYQPDVAPYRNQCKSENCDNFQIDESLFYYQPILNEEKTMFMTKQRFPKTRDIPGKPLVLSDKPASIFEEFTPNTEEPSSPDDPANPYTKEFKNTMLICYFQDGVMPFLMHDFVHKPANKKILTMYERGLPAWAVFFCSYGIPYRYWMRNVMAYIIFFMSLFTMLLGFYDLYKNIPAIHGFLHGTFGPLLDWFEEKVILRLSILLGYVVASSHHFTRFITLLASPVITGPVYFVIELITSMLTPIISVFGFCSDFLKPVLNFVYTVVALVLIVAKHAKDFIFTTVILPFDIIRLFFSTIASTLTGIMGIIHGTGDAVAVAQNVNQTLGVFGWIKWYWNNVFRFITRVISTTYHFTLYSIWNIYKHKESFWMSLENYYRTNRPGFMHRVYQLVALIIFYYVVFQVLLKSEEQDL